MARCTFLMPRYRSPRSFLCAFAQRIVRKIHLLSFSQQVKVFCSMQTCSHIMTMLVSFYLRVEKKFFGLTGLSLGSQSVQIRIAASPFLSSARLPTNAENVLQPHNPRSLATFRLESFFLFGIIYQATIYVAFSTWQTSMRIGAVSKRGATDCPLIKTRPYPNAMPQQAACASDLLRINQNSGISYLYQFIILYLV